MKLFIHSRTVANNAENLFANVSRRDHSATKKFRCGLKYF